MHCIRLVLLLLISCLFASELLGIDTQPPPKHLEFFENEIRPILVEHCLDCHSSENDEPEANLRLDTRDGWMIGGDSGSAILPGEPADSLIMDAIRYRNTDLQMPPDGKLSDREIATLEKWIEMGAPDPREGSNEPAPKSDFNIDERRRSHWCWQPIRADVPPSVKDTAWPVKTLDRYILSKLEDAGLSPAPQADRATLLRRVTFDLIGLPPSPTELADFLGDESDNAYGKVVSRLLESPHFGEHWGQHWLDLVRYAETRGHEQDFDIPEAFKFRDYVITAFNEDVPYDQFLTEHVAGDLVKDPRLHPQDRSNQSIQGTGFWHLHEQTHSPVDIQGDEADRIHNQIDVFSRAFLGLSIGCARCHDHKFDAISARDYYALYGYLQSSSYRIADASDPLKQQTVFAQLQELNHDSTSTLTEAFISFRSAQLKRFPKMLTAAAALIRSGKPLDATPESTAKESKTRNKEKKKRVEATPSEIVIKTATERGFEPLRLWRLAKHLTKVAEARNVLDPLHVFASFTQQSRSDAETIKKTQQEAYARLCDHLRQNGRRRSNQTVSFSNKDGERNYKTVERPWRPEDVVEDFQFDENTAERRWISAGYRFGDGPRSVSVPLLSDSVNRPIRWFLDAPAAQTVSNRFQGFLRTRTFEVVGDRLWYRYRGNAEAFLAVDSHRVVAGPLHGVVKQQLENDTCDWKWFSHPVRDYVGHRVHVEFRPKGDFAVDQVVFSAEQPPEPMQQQSLAMTLSQANNIQDASTLARFTAHELRTCIRSNQPQYQILNWLIHHGALLPRVESAEREFQEAAESYVTERAKIEGQLPSPVSVLALLDGDAEDEPVHIRGNHRNRSKDNVPRGILTALRRESESASVSPATESGRRPLGSGRLALARELTSAENPLVARVIVNRIWHHLFGRGIVETVDDFGVMGKPPTHPALLDHLAKRFMDSGWSMKQAIRNVVMSRTYRMSSYPDDAYLVVDPTNRLFHRMSVRRLPAESIRDHVLAVSGRLDRRMFGKSTMVHITPYMRGNRSPGGSGPLDGDGRRSIYTEVRRNHLSAFLTAFDKPAPFMAIGKRTVSNSPSQSLILLNDPFVHEQASLWAKRLLAEGESDDERLGMAYLWAFAREPTSTEREATLAFVAGQRVEYRGEVDAEARVWADLCHTLFNVKEFVHIN